MKNKLIINIKKYYLGKLYAVCQSYFFDMIACDFLDWSQMSYLFSIKSQLRFCQRILTRYVIFKNLKGNKKLYKKPTGEDYIIINNSVAYISFSYSKNYIIECFSQKKLGVDIEEIVSDLPLSIINKNAILKNGSLTQESFTKLWTIQESYCKYMQVGLKEMFKKEQIRGVRSLRLKNTWISYVSDCNMSIQFIN